jgi:hypothetical protein
MKKTLALLLALSMIFALCACGSNDNPSTASSSSDQKIVEKKSVYDLASLTDEDLMALPGKIAKEQINRGLVKSAVISSGTYIIGEDIPAGDYTLTQLSNNSTIAIVFYPGDEARFTTTLQDSKHLINLLTKGVESGKITLEEGESLYIYGGDTEIKVYTGVEFK